MNGDEYESMNSTSRSRPDIGLGCNFAIENGEAYGQKVSKPRREYEAFAIPAKPAQIEIQPTECNLFAVVVEAIRKASIISKETQSTSQ